MKAEDLSGRRFGRLTVVALAGRTKNRQSKWRCVCDCGNETTVSRGCLTDGHTGSCGCLHAKANGEARNGRQTPEYVAWAEMKRRCENKSAKGWHNYGGRGITICEKWRWSYPSFLADVGRRPSPKHILDRINVNGHYEPGNVRWATASQQMRNRRPYHSRGWRQSAKHAWSVVRTFESVVASYAGAKYGVAVDSCTNALLLACAYHKVSRVTIPRFTYVGVPCSIKNAGGSVLFSDEQWAGVYQLKPYQIYDAARHFTSGMYIPGSLMCLSFHWTKHLPIGHGGMILCDDPKAAAWLRRCRYDGRTEGVSPKKDRFILGWHVMMSPTSAAQGLLLMAGMAEHNDPLPWGPGTDSDYPDLSRFGIFK